MTFPFGFTAQLVGVATEDRHGDKTFAPDVPIEGCAFAPGSSGRTADSNEDSDRKHQVVRSGALYVPPTSPEIKPDSKIRLPASVTADQQDTVWQVEGAQANWASPFTTWNAGREVRIRRVSG